MANEQHSGMTVDHEAIRAWIEARGGRPAVVADTHDGSGGILRIDFGEPENSLEEIPWDEFFRVFEERDLAFLYQDQKADGSPSFFFKFVDREAHREEIDGAS